MKKFRQPDLIRPGRQVVLSANFEIILNVDIMFLALLENLPDTYPILGAEFQYEAARIYET